jgi:hypothetical protein
VIPMPAAIAMFEIYKILDKGTNLTIGKKHAEVFGNMRRTNDYY